jgi:hypothetical protein
MRTMSYVLRFLNMTDSPRVSCFRACEQRVYLYITTCSVETTFRVKVYLNVRHGIAFDFAPRAIAHEEILRPCDLVLL